MTTPYTTGTISLTNGSAVVTGIGTAWQIALIKGGIVYPEAAGNGLPVATVDSDTQITAAVDWTGTTGTYSYALVRDTAYDAQIAQNAEALARLLAGLEAGTIWKYDMSGDTAGRDIYDGKPKGFSYLDVSVVPAQLWVKASNTEGDWAGPFNYGQGPAGPPGTPGEDGEDGAPGPYTDISVGDVTTLPSGSSATVTATPTSPGAIELEFGIPAGADGTGTGDVIGPAGATNGHLAVFADATGKVLEDGGAPFSGAYADLSGKPTLGDAAAKNVGTAAGTVAAGDDPRFSAGGSSKNEAIFALEIADLKGSRLGMNGGIADAFDDETGVATKTNATYDAAQDWYVPLATTADERSGTGTASATAGWTYVNKSFEVNNNASVDGIYIYSDLAYSGTARILLRNSATSYTFLTGASAAFSHPGGGTWQFFPFTSPVSIPATGSYYCSIFGTGASPTPRGFQATVPRAYCNADVTGTQASGWTEEASSSAPSIGVRYVTGFGNMALKSVDYTAASVPSAGRLAVQVVEVDSVTINTDVIAKISRDGGTTWATAVLSLSQSLIGPKIYEANNINLSSLASGTSMKWEIDTANNKNVAVSGVVMQWS